MRIHVLPVIFCGLLVALGVSSLFAPSQLRLKGGMAKSVLTGSASGIPQRWKTFALFLDQNLAENVCSHWAFVELNGLCQVAQGKNLVQDSGLTAIYRQPGTGNLLIPEKRADQLPAIVGNLCKLREGLPHGVPLLVCIAPDKSCAVDAAFPVGYEFRGRENLARFLQLAQASGLDVLDLRGMIHGSEDYFRTDHHWKAATAFWAAGRIVNWLRERQVLDSDTSFDPVSNRYQKILFPHAFVGSWGKRVGEVWSGSDIMELYSPRFAASFVLDMKALRSADVHRQGSFETTLFDPSVIKSNARYCNYWAANFGSRDWSSIRIRNLRASSSRRLLFIEDSYGLGTIPYVAPVVRELIALDLRSLRDVRASQVVRDVQPDAVVILYSAEQLLIPHMFEF